MTEQELFVSWLDREKIPYDINNKPTPIETGYLDGMVRVRHDGHGDNDGLGCWAMFSFKEDGSLKNVFSRTEI